MPVAAKNNLDELYARQRLLQAEVARLESLGAMRIEFVKRWWVMEAPTGHRFCVVRKQRAEFGSHTNEWND